MRSTKRKRDAMLNIPCGWLGCRSVLEDDFALHLHITEHFNKSFPKPEENTYTCPMSACDFKTQDQKELQRHVYFHGYFAGLVIAGKKECDSNPDIPKCSAPKRIGDKIPELKTDFCCEWTDCQRTFLSVVEFQDHIVQHASFEYEIQKTPDDERPKIQCNWNYCKKQLDNKYRLIEHIRTHSNKKQVACHHCGELFRTKTTLFDHLRRQPDNNSKH